MINLYDSKCTDFNNNGIASLIDTSKCEVTEELNGEFTIEFEYPRNSKYADKIDNDMIIKVDTGGTERQLFRIKGYEKDLTTIKATPQHISYDLIDNALDDVYPQNLDGNSAINWILEHTQYNHKFTGFSDITKQGTARYVRKNVIEAIIGDLDNSFVNVWGGEIERNNFNIRMLSKRGTDKGYKIKYAKNLSGIDFSKDDSNIITRLRPIGYDGLLLPEKYVDSPLINNYPHPKIGEIEYSDIKLKENEEDEEGFDTLEQCYAELRKRANQEFSINNIDKPTINAKVDFIDLSKTTQYKDYKILTDVKLGDTVYVSLDNMIISVRVIKTVYDALLHRFTSLELGEFKDNYITDTDKNVSNIVKKETESISNNILSTAKKEATELILQATTGYVVLRPNEILIMDTNDTNTAQKVWRWNVNGFGYSSTGVNGPYGTAITMNGAIVADFITAGSINASLIKTGSLNASLLKTGSINADLIKTGSINASLIKTGTLDADLIKTGTINANLIKAGTMSLNRLLGDILSLGGSNNANGKIEIKNSNGNTMATLDVNGLTLANGARLIGGNGVLSNFQYISSGNYKGFDLLGYSVNYYGNSSSIEYTYGDVTLDVYIPSDFIITSAYLMLQHTPVAWYGYDQAQDKDYNCWGYARNIRLYKATGNQNYKFDMTYLSSFDLYTKSLSVTEIPNAFGSSGWTPSTHSGATYETKTSIDIKSQLKNGYQKLVIRCSGSLPTNFTNAAQRTGVGRAILNVIGYKS